jgi:acyl carrier protein
MTAETHRAVLTRAVKLVAIAESRLGLDPDSLPDDEPLNGRLLKVTSLGFLGMLMRLEDEAGVSLPDDLFVGRAFRTVADLVDVIADQAGETGAAR